MKTAIVTDSTGYLTSDILERFQIQVVPLNVTIGDETFAETNLSNKDLFYKLSNISGFSTTSQPSVGAFLEVYEALFASGAEDIVSIHISRALSGTPVAAQMACDLASRPNIYVVDSGSTALSLGLMVWGAAEWAEQGLPAHEIVEKLKELKRKTELYFIVETLDNLRRGGRIGGGAALIGTLLQIKPILYVNDRGEIDVFDKVRSRAKAWKRVGDQLDQALAQGFHYRICVQHIGIPELGEKIADELRTKYPEHEIRVFEVGPVIATHVGPGTFGLSFQPWPFVISNKQKGD
ncbi:MAG: DegV family protein [Desulfitobacteriaceae bacterium]